MKRLNLSLALIFHLVVLIALGTKSSSFLAVLFFLPLITFPILVSAFLSHKFRSLFSQTFLFISQILYFLWAGYVYLNAFYWHLDPQSAIALLFIAPYSIPVMCLLWSVAYFGRKPKNLPSSE